MTGKLQLVKMPRELGTPGYLKVNQNILFTSALDAAAKMLTFKCTVCSRGNQVLVSSGSGWTKVWVPISTLQTKQNRTGAWIGFALDHKTYFEAPVMYSLPFCLYTCVCLLNLKFHLYKFHLNLHLV